MKPDNALRKCLRDHPDYLDEQLVKENKALQHSKDGLEQQKHSLERRLEESKKKKKEFQQEIKKLKKEKKEARAEAKKEYDQKIKEVREELKEENARSKRLERERDDLLKIIQVLTGELQQANESLKDLEEQTTKRVAKASFTNSTNSDLPPSMSQMSHSPKKEEKKHSKSILKPGGQPGHEGHFSQLWPNPDHIKRQRVKKAPSHAVRGVDKDGVEYFAVQEIDLRSLDPYVIETRYYLKENGKTLNKKILDKYRVNPVSYSTRYKAVVLLLNSYTAIPFNRLRKTLIYIVGEEKASLIPSVGSMCEWEKEFSEAFQPEREKIAHKLLKKGILDVDETSNKVNGELVWIHVLTCVGLTLYFVTEKRGDWENGPLALLIGFTGLLVCDHFVCYQKLGVITCECMAHYVRHLKKGVDFDHNPQCQMMIGIFYGLLWIKKECQEKGETEMDPAILEEARACLLEAANEGINNYKKEEADRKKRLGDKAHKVYKATYVPTLKRFLKKPDDYLRWAYDFDVPFSNNLAEQRLRATKAKKKASGQFRSMSGAQAYVDLLTCITNAEDNEKNPLTAIIEVLTRKSQKVSTSSF